ncbi:MAG: hypothetical protein ABI678_20330 [Kofleriaceae bacterium]
MRRLLVVVAACHGAPVAVPAATEAACAVALPKLAAEHTPNVNTVYVAPLAIRGDALAVGAPVRTSKHGYVNQASFSLDGKGLYFTWRPDGSQADIWYRDLATGAEHAVTCSSEEEYSATQTGEGLVVIRVEPDLTRRLVQLDAAGKVVHVLFPDVPNIGAYLWIDDTTTALFFGDDGGTRIALGNPRTGEVVTVAEQVSAAMSVIPGAGAISFIDQSDEAVSRLMRIDLKTRAITPVIQVPDGVERVAWLGDGSVLYGDGTKLMRGTMGSPPREVADLRGSIEGAIKRVSVSADRIAIVTH